MSNEIDQSLIFRQPSPLLAPAEPNPLPYYVAGMTPEFERRFREMVDVMKPTKYPTQFVMVPEDRYRMVQKQMASGMWGGSVVRKQGGETLNSDLGCAFTIPAANRVWIDDGCAKKYDDKRFFGVVAHELSHVAGNSSENDARKGQVDMQDRLTRYLEQQKTKQK